MSEPYKMPPIDAGTPVLYYPGANKLLKPIPGFVSAVNPTNLNVHVLHAESYNFSIKDGVRHVDDPSLQANPYAREDGGWDYHPLHKAVMLLQRKVDELCNSLGEPTKVG